MRSVLSSALARNRSRDLAQRQMRRRQRYAQPSPDEHHHHIRCARLRGEKLGMAGERNACIVDDCLVNGRRHHGREFATLASGKGAAEERHDVCGVARVELSGMHRCPRRDMQHLQDAGQVRCLRTVVGETSCVAQKRGTRFQHIAIAKNHQPRRQWPAGKFDAEVGPDACRLAVGQGDDGDICCGHRLN